MDLVLVALSGIFLFLPAMVPNSAAVLFGGGVPVDFGQTWKGHRLLGDGKTWTGLIGGVAAGTSLGIVLIILLTVLDVQEPWSWGSGMDGVLVVLTLALGSLLGDMTGAFIKRRLSMERGHKAPVLDQYDFVAGALLLTALFHPDWVAAHYINDGAIVALVALLVFIPVLHRGVNIIGYKLGKKKEPW
jgi:CDP-2,3-bis-(O-geranylgeranyl)-sn-glycerol synthase